MADLPPSNLGVRTRRTAHQDNRVGPAGRPRATIERNEDADEGTDENGGGNSQEDGEDNEEQALRKEQAALEREEAMHTLRADVASRRARQATGWQVPQASPSTISDANETRASSSRGSAYPRVRQPELFKAKTLKEARKFIRQLEVIFQLAPADYGGEHAKVLYASMYLDGEVADNWHHKYNVSNLGLYTWDEFKTDMLDAVEDPVNRGLTVAKAYEKAKQGEGQTAQSFAAYLATLEEQMEPYTPAQRMQHLLVKLREPLCDAITVFHEMPKTRDALISLATRLETADTKHSAGGTRASHKHTLSDAQGQPTQKKLKFGQFSGRDRSQGRNNAPPLQLKGRGPLGAPPLSDVRCYECNETGHIRPNCPNKDKMTARKVEVIDRESRNESAARRTAADSQL